MSDFLKLAAPGVRGLHPYQPGKPIEELEREYGVSNIIKLASTENPLGPSPLALAAAQQALQDVWLYPDGAGFVLKQKLSEKFGFAMNLITLGNGSSDVLEFAVRAFVTPHDEVIFSKHSFAVYPILTQAAGARAVVTPAKNWGNDLAAMRDAVTERTRLIFIANPNNPTGTCLGRSELESFIGDLPSHVIVVLDEAYFEYAQSDLENFEYFTEANPAPGVEGDFYLAQDGNYVLFSHFKETRTVGGYEVTEELTSIDQLTEIVLPAGFVPSNLELELSVPFPADTILMGIFDTTTGSALIIIPMTPL